MLAVLPFGLFLVLLLGIKTRLSLASFLTFSLTLFLGLFFWSLSFYNAAQAIIKGFWVALDIFIIISGALFFLKVLEERQVLHHLTLYLESISKDYRVRVILLAWFLENFIEGTAGFGTPSAVVAPILVSLGLSPLSSVIISLLGNSTSVAFGAVGTPIRVGFENLALVDIALPTALINCLGFLVPVFMLWTMSRLQDEKRKHFLEGLPFALWAGIAFVVPSLLIAHFGSEFPSIFGSVIGLILVLITTKFKLFLPSTVRTLTENALEKKKLPLSKVVLPYFLLILFLLGGKFLLGKMFNPGFAFFIAGFCFATPVVFTHLKKSLKSSLEPFFVIFSMSALVQIMLSAGSLASLANRFQSRALPFFSPFIGAFGSFITGSATVSNIMFGKILHLSSLSLNFKPEIILALELVGAAAGNMIALADILAAETVVGLKNQERAVLKGVILPCFIYVLLVAIVGLMIK